MKIVYLDLDDIKNPLLGAGQAVATAGAGAALSKLGHEVEVICSKYPGYKDRTENGITYKHIGICTKYIKLNNAFFFFALPAAVRKIKADIIIECFMPPISTSFSPLFTKVPVVVLPSMFNAKEFSKKYHLPFELFESVGVKLYKYALPYSEVDSKKLTDINPNIKYKIVKQGVGSEYFEINKNQSEHILFLGRFDVSQKGIDLLIESYKQVADQIPYKLVIAGHGPDEAKVKTLIKDAKLENKIEIVGSAYGEKKRDLMSKALFVAFPSRHDEICLWTLEALAGGLPIICFDLPESKWLLPNVSLKAKCFDTKEYAQLLLKACNKDLIEPMQLESRQFAAAFKWENVAAEFISFFEEIIKNESK